MIHEKFSPSTLREAGLPHYSAINGTDIDALKVRLKLYDRGSGWVWYVVGACLETGTCFGWVARGQNGGGIEYFQLRELNEMQGKAGVNIRRSPEWNQQTTLGQVIEERVR